VLLPASAPAPGAGPAGLSVPAGWPGSPCNSKSTGTKHHDTEDSESDDRHGSLPRSDTLGSARPRLGATVTQAGTPTVGAARLTKLGWPPARARVRRAADPKSNVCIEIRIPSRRRNLSESLVRISLNL